MNDGMRMGSGLKISVVRPGGTIHRGWTGLHVDMANNYRYTKRQVMSATLW